MRSQPDLQPATGEPNPGTPSRGVSLLLAEDDSAMRGLLACALRRGGFDVIEACNGSELLERLAHGLAGKPGPGFDLIISDVRMPGYDGLNVLASLRQMSVPIPVILVTAFGTAASHAAAAQLGAFALLDKPFDLDDLVALARLATLAAGRDEGGA